jgi:hypothetical protein
MAVINWKVIKDHHQGDGGDYWKVIKDHHQGDGSD